jgi:acetyl esterase/lipase
VSNGDPVMRVMRELRSLPSDHEVGPGVRAGEALELMTVPPAPEGCVHEPERAYGTAGPGGRALTMHLYRRADPTERRPGVVFIHGGGFWEGFPEMVIAYAHHLAALGYVTASIRYRLSGEAPFPACVQDAKCAVRWLRAHAADIGLDPDRLAVSGPSAGGHVAAMVSSTPGLFEGEGGEPGVSSAVNAAVLLYPALDLRPSRMRALNVEMAAAVAQALAQLSGEEHLSEERAAAMSPISYAAGASPTLTVVGDADPLAPLDPARAYHRILDREGVPNQLVVVPDAGHSFDAGRGGWQRCVGLMVPFLDEHLRAPGSLGPPSA